MSTTTIFNDTIGGLPEDQQNISPARGIAKWNHNLRGIEIIQIGNTYPGMEVHCIQTYLSIFIEGHTYVRSADNSRWLDTTQRKHTHSADTDEEGGYYRNVQIENASDYFETKWEPMRLDMWHKNTLGGDIWNYPEGVGFQTLDTAGNYYQITNGGHRLSFESVIDFKYKGYLFQDQSRMTSFRGGINCEKVWETSNIRRMFGLEWCDDNNEERNYQFFSSGGSERNSVVSGITAISVNAFGFRFIPNSVIKITVDQTSVIMTKGDNIPRSLATTTFDTVKFGIKTQANADKEYIIKTVRLIGKISDLSPW